jgi:hypothetical protein
VDHNPNQVLLARTPRRTAYLKHWKALPESLFTAYEEPGRYKGARAKRIHVAETTNAILADKHSTARHVRTIVAREEGLKGKDRWHALFVFRDNATAALSLIQEFRARQRHEQTYRVLLHDAFVDAVPSGYFKHSPNPDRSGFRKGPLPSTLGWPAWPSTPCAPSPPLCPLTSTSHTHAPFAAGGFTSPPTSTSPTKPSS